MTINRMVSMCHSLLRWTVRKYGTGIPVLTFA
jgi:hypothetical protein